MKRYLYFLKLSTTICLSFSFLTSSVLAASPEAFRRKDISNARFGEGERENYLAKAHTLSAAIQQDVRGQEIAAQILQNRVVQYFENFGNRTGEPVYMNLIGLPGVGKTATVSKLKALGFPIAHYDAQNYSTKGDEFTQSVFNRIKQANSEKKPLILIVEEVDKVPEITKIHGEVTSPVIGTINQILSDGVVSLNGSLVDASNVMVLTTMNFSPDEMERFTGEVLKEQKSFYDLGIEDMQKFNDWIKTQPSARYKILSHLFRSNTVRRMAPFTVIMQPLLEDTYREIINGVVDRAIKRNTKGPNEKKRVKVEIDQSVIDFLFRETVFAPSGAGETVLRADAITDQLINFAIKAKNGENDDSIDRPRIVKIAIDLNSSQATLNITPQVYHHPRLDSLPSFDVLVDFDRSSGLFMPPEEMAVSKPIYATLASRQGVEKAITRREVEDFRYPSQKNKAEGLSEALSSQILGQEAAINLIEDEMNKYLALSKPTSKEPMFKALSGFPGIGKSEIVKQTAAYLKLPVIKVNMQQFISDDPKSVSDFVATVNSLIEEKQKEITEAGGKFIFLLEELDKAFEIDPQGLLKNRPIMAIIKDLLNEGHVTVSTQTSFGSSVQSNIDIRAAYTFITMNFSVDRFGFTADPRMTSVTDVIDAWKKLKSSIAGIKQLLGSMFLPETVSRLMSQFVIMKPLSEADYKKLIGKQVEKVIQSRLQDARGRNVGKIKIELSPKYREYLFNEAVIPSEGARNAVVRSQNLISTDLEKALSSLPKSKFGANPLTLTLDFYPGSDEVVVRAKIDNDNSKGSKGEIVLKRPISLNFPRLDVKGKISQERLSTSAHELGHALLAARLGLRIDQVVVVPTMPGAGGYVKFKNSGQHAVDLMANVYATVASRAMERMIYSDDPRSPRSVLELTAGPSQDIKQASMILFNMIYELGMDPHGGTIDRNFILGVNKYADFASIPPELAEKLGNILRAMENQVLEDLLSAHSKEWYVDKTTKLATKGAMNEKEFYDLIGYTYPGDNVEGTGRTYHIREMFKHIIKDKAPEVRKSQQQRRGLNNETVEETVERYLRQFAETLEMELHPKSNIAPVTSLERIVKQQQGGSLVRSCKDVYLVQ